MEIRSHREEITSDPMDNLTFGLTLLVVGMGGTLLTLFIMALIIQALTAIFPVKEEDDK